MGTIRLSPGSIGFSKGSDRSGQIGAGFRKTIDRVTVGAFHLIWNFLVDYQRRYETRHRLRNMDDRQLRDIGLNRREADRMADRTFRLF
ncbi:MAG: DUF1127 domain-containing protein [Alphaproteobacteria bacterium]|nr:DUF1127 domain-containing protein [Alphaproteobacteria bacterium]